MKLHHIAAAVAVLSLASVSAQATLVSATPAHNTIVADAKANNRVISISGASAVRAGFYELVKKMFVGTPIAFSSGANLSQDYIAAAGVLASGSGAWSGKNVIVVYRVKGGSVFGVDPVARATSIPALDVNTSCGAAGGSGSDTSPYQCGTTLMVPDAGVSDVAPALFASPTNTEGETAAPQLSAAELASLTITPLYSLAFGIPVTSNVPDTAKLNRATVSAIMTGNISDWSQVKDAGSGDIVICRRTPGSGSQAVMNLWAGNYPCNTDAQQFPADRDASGAWDASAKKFTAANGAGGLIVIENSSSSQVASCLTAAVNGGVYGTFDRDGVAVSVDFGAGGYKAIGVLSMDSLASSTAASKWQFRSLDGAGKVVAAAVAGAAPTLTGTGRFPTLASLMTGDWDLQGWVSFNVPSRTVGAKADALAKFANAAQDPAVIGSVAALKQVAAAIPGGAYSGAQVLNVGYQFNNQCAPLNRNF